MSKTRCVGIVAPSAKIKDGPQIPQEELVAFVESKGFTAKVQPNIYGEDIFYANSDALRAEGFIEILKDPEVDIIWALRGGSGAASLIGWAEENGIDLSSLHLEQKKYVGYSDSTAMHVWLSNSLGWDTLVHGTMILELYRATVDEETQDRLLALLRGDMSGKMVEYSVTPLFSAHSGYSALASACEATVIGGNLTVLESSIGTKWQPDFSGKIVLLEDVRTYGYSVERSFTHFIQAGMFDDVEAILLGDFTLPEGATKRDAVEMEASYARLQERVDFPVFKASNIGHGQHNDYVVFNAPARFVSTADAWSLQIDIPEDF